MRRFLTAWALLLCGAGGSAAAQSSIFDARALGIPQPPLSARAVSLAGSMSLLDGMSSTNPAAITSILDLTIGFNYFQNWRTSTSLGGTGTGSDAGMPNLIVVNRIKETPFYISGSFGSSTDRDFGFVTTDSTPVNGQPVGYRDSLESRGGTSDFRLAVGYRNGKNLALGFGFHFITGSNRFFLSRIFADSLFTPVRQRSELAYNAIGASLGAVYHPIEPLLLAALVRRDGSMNVDRDSVNAYSYSLPWTIAGGIQYQLKGRGTISAEFTYRTWSDANDALLATGGIGAENTLDAALGVELYSSSKQSSKFPLRLGVRSRQLPFPLTPGVQPTEFSVAGGTGGRFAKGHAAVDVALQRLWRSDDTGFSEDAWVLTFGLTLKP